MKAAVCILIALAITSIQTLGKGEGICGNVKKFQAQDRKTQISYLNSCMKLTGSDDPAVAGVDWLAKWAPDACKNEEGWKTRRMSLRKLGNASPVYDTLGYDCLAQNSGKYRLNEGIKQCQTVAQCMQKFA